MLFRASSKRKLQVIATQRLGIVQKRLENWLFKIKFQQISKGAKQVSLHNGRHLKIFTLASRLVYLHKKLKTWLQWLWTYIVYPVFFELMLSKVLESVVLCARYKDQTFLLLYHNFTMIAACAWSKLFWKLEMFVNQT